MNQNLNFLKLLYSYSPKFEDIKNILINNLGMLKTTKNIIIHKMEGARKRKGA